MSECRSFKFGRFLYHPSTGYFVNIPGIGERSWDSMHRLDAEAAARKHGVPCEPRERWSVGRMVGSAWEGRYCSTRDEALGYAQRWEAHELEQDAAWAKAQEAARERAIRDARRSRKGGGS